jgi:predicted membrane chloride channel (bestrophin family)
VLIYGFGAHDQFHTSGFEQCTACTSLYRLYRSCHRTDSSYARWEEALKSWNEVRSLSKDLARQVSGDL